jgi:hypothetical protein
MAETEVKIWMRADHYRFVINDKPNFEQCLAVSERWIYAVVTIFAQKESRSPLHRTAASPLH